MPSVNSVRPTLSLLLIAENASVALSSVTSSRFVCQCVPRLCDALMSTSSMHGHLALFAEQLHERPAGAGRHVPIDRPHVVADLVRSHFLELDAAAFERRVPLAGQQFVDDVRRVDLDAADLLDDFAGKHVANT